MLDIYQDKKTSATDSKIDSRSIIHTASPLRHTPLSTLNYLLTTQQLTSRTLTEFSLHLIASTNPTYNHTLDTSPIAIDTATTLDTALQRRSALHGIPILLKDNIPTLGGGMNTACGSLALVGAVPSEEAEVVDVLLHRLARGEICHHMYEPTKQALLRDLDIAISTPCIHGIRIAIPCPYTLREFQNLSPFKTLAFDNLVLSLKEAGATVIRNVAIPGAPVWASLSLPEQTILFYADMKASINAYLSSLTTNPYNITDLASLIAFTKHHPDEQYPHRNVEGLENAQDADLDASLYKKMLEKEDYFINGEGGIHAALTACCADVMILPTLSPTMQMLAAKAGSPVMSVPMGIFPVDTIVEKDEGSGLVSVAPGIPFSAYIFGRGGKDEVTMKVGYAVERARRVQERLVPYLEAVAEEGS
ncbi:Amidase [Pyrenophora teres f. maculata]|nr:Amidase [Pyrenophora teres f. maculata]